jgi:hypothetical protein
MCTCVELVSQSADVTLTGNLVSFTTEDAD